MFRRHEVTLLSNPVCVRRAEVSADDFFYYDKDGFELNRAEQQFYRAMNYPIHYPLLNHTCWQEPWFELESNSLGLIIDHSMFLCRASYSGEAQQQLEELKSSVPLADYLLRTKKKWGFDFALDAVAEDGTVFEVLHVEYDNYNFEKFCQQLQHFDFTVRHTDWFDAAKKIQQHKNEWANLKSFAQNDWKARFLIGWKKAEYTEKSLTLQH